eukprot:CAMPEP_0202967170 /NCGR_PEP_ID=MMETSP1396-20130829/11952_1 /ASSEMBLY_ACC=CAM_ASM_000872 /TAXON_ID= /ORGANISM="Pseudokeronopsis sp., Strain Brazil" /LENGTH=195 /DNA_ID=CAMNT_0049691925 /DNA_START=548 /DNA_END=1136 /DNA_ORIENTATION=+
MPIVFYQFEGPVSLFEELKEKELFMIISRVDELIELCFKLFEKKSCSNSNRLLSSIFYQLYVDLIKIYQAYYLLVTVVLEVFAQLSTMDMKRSLIIYSNFIHMNQEIKAIVGSSSVDGAKMMLVQRKEGEKGEAKFQFYEADPKVVDYMKVEIDMLDRRLKKDTSSSLSNSNQSKNNTEEGLIRELFEEIEKKGA